MSISYELDRNASESERLDIQHAIWTKNLGFLLHPSLASRFGANCRIADVGTGTGVFLIDLAKQFPAPCTLDGFDISTAQFQKQLPDNVSLIEQDAKKPFPSQYHGQYDVVHLRLMISGMEKDDWEVVARNVVDLLKPGGAIQWEEADLLSVMRLKGLPTSRTASLTKVGSTFKQALIHRFAYGWCTLPGIFNTLGLEDVVQDITATDRIPETRDALTRVSYLGALSWARLMMSRKPPGVWTMQEIDELERECALETDSGGYTRYDIYLTLGIKPTM